MVLKINRRFLTFMMNKVKIKELINNEVLKKRKKKYYERLLNEKFSRKAY